MRRTTTVILALLPALACSRGRNDPQPSGIRILNASAHDMQDLQVGAEQYGTLFSQHMTEYRVYPIAYEYNYVKATVLGQVLILRPIDYVGETPLGAGRFTYVLEVNYRDGQLAIQISLVRDP